MTGSRLHSAAVSDTAVPPHDVAEVLARPYPERARLLARNWAHKTPNTSR